MPLTIQTQPDIVHPGALGGDQSNGKVAVLADGSFVVAWNRSIVATELSRFSADGTVLGSAIIPINGRLQDMVITGDGRINLLLADTNSVHHAVLDGQTLGLIGSQTIGSGFLALGTISAQMVARNANTLDILITDAGNNARVAVNTAAQVVEPFTIPALANGSLVEGVAGNVSGEIVGLTASGFLVTSSGLSRDLSALAPRDIVKVSPDFYVVVSVTSSNQIVLTGLSGLPSESPVFFAQGPSVVGSQVAGISGTGQTTTAHELVDLGGGRILALFGSFRGSPTVSGSFAVSGVYAQVYDMQAGVPEQTALLVQSIFSLTDLQQVRLQGSVMADGRVAVAITRPNGLTGLDVFRTILDPRETGVTVAATAGADMYVGSAFDDTFTGVAAGDSILGGNGSDTVVFAGGGPVTLDLAQPLAFGAAPVVLESVENITSSTGFDVILGNQAANILNGNGGTDMLAGRGGDDSLIGGSGNDTLDGGAGNDTLEGGSDSDLLAGGAGADLLLGGSGDDTQSGGSDTDTLQGGDGDDVLTGGQGDDLIFGGSGNDTIDARFGADTLFGGSGGDSFIMDQNSGALVDGGSGTDTLNYGRIDSSAVGPGIYVDLAGTVDALAARFGFEADAVTATAVENLRGARGSDLLAGSGLGNLLFGNDGNDILLGRGGSDTLIGGEGADLFVFENAAGGNDRIRDFTVGEDKIALFLDGFGDIDAGNIAARFVANAAATPAANGNAQILFDNSGGGAGRLLFDADGNGAGAAVLFATLVFSQPTGLATFGAADFAFL